MTPTTVKLALLFFYVLPTFISLVTTLTLLIKDVRYDVENRTKGYYRPRASVRHVVLAVVTPLIPCWNILYAMHEGLAFFSWLTCRLNIILDKPIVPPKKG